MYSPYVGTDDIPTEVTPAVEDSDGPSWFFVVRSSACCPAASLICLMRCTCSARLRRNGQSSLPLMGLKPSTVNEA